MHSTMINIGVTLCIMQECECGGGSEGDLGIETDVIWGSDDETPGLSGRIFQAGRADGECV